MEEQNEKRYNPSNNKKSKSRLFGAPVTAKKVVIWVLLALLIVAIVFVVRFVFRTVINPSAAFDNTPVVTPVLTSNTPAPTPTITEQTAALTGTPQTPTPLPTTRR